MREIDPLWRPSPPARCDPPGADARHAGRLMTRTKAFRRPVRTSQDRPVAQAYYNKQAGISASPPRPGWPSGGCSMALAGHVRGSQPARYMVKVSYGQKPYRRSMMIRGRRVFASPSNMTETGRNALAADPNNEGSLGLAIWKPSKKPRRAPTPTTRSVRCSTTSRCTRRSSALKRRSSSRWPAIGPM